MIVGALAATGATGVIAAVVTTARIRPVRVLRPRWVRPERVDWAITVGSDLLAGEARPTGRPQPYNAWIAVPLRASGDQWAARRVQVA